MRGARYVGPQCARCGHTERYVSTRRCVPCQIFYGKQHKATSSERDAMRGRPCALCGVAMKQPCYDESPVTGFRAWLCHQCNLGLGHLRHDPALLRAAALYLEGGSPSFISGGAD